MFTDPNKNTAGQTEKAAIEIMVWFAAYGPATQPLGMSTTGIVESRTSSCPT
jgi:hypothetical protein